MTTHAQQSAFESGWIIKFGDGRTIPMDSLLVQYEHPVPLTYLSEHAKLIAHAWAIPQLVEALAANVELMEVLANATEPAWDSMFNKAYEQSKAALRAVEEQTP